MFLAPEASLHSHGLQEMCSGMAHCFMCLYHLISIWLHMPCLSRSCTCTSDLAFRGSICLQNIASHPGEAKYSHIRLGNTAFHSRAGQYAAARELLQVAGFTEEAEGIADKAFVWKRNDQGLLWLTLSAVNNALQGTA